MADDAEKTEDATPYKLEQARDSGDVPLSREFTALAAFAGLILSFWFFSDHIFRNISLLFEYYFNFNAHPLETSQDVMKLLVGIIKQILILIAPTLATTTFFGVASTIAQIGFLLTTEKLEPNFSKLNPMSGFAKIFSRETAVDFGKSLLKVGVLGSIMFLVLRGEAEKLVQLGTLSLPLIFKYFVMTIAKVLLVTLVFMAVLGISDLAYQRWNYFQKLKMSAEEVKEEHKQREGDPFVKSRIRQIQRERARQRMMEKVPKADVVVTNPTHVAVALEYKRGVNKAPVVLAKGAGYIAVKIKEIAAKNEVPILERKELARFLYRHVEIGDMIPETLYTAVAEILAYVYKMKKRFSAWRKAQA